MCPAKARDSAPLLRQQDAAKGARVVVVDVVGVAAKARDTGRR